MEILSVQTVPIIHSAPSVTTQVHMFCYLHSGDQIYLFFFSLFWPVAAPHIISSHVNP